MNSTLSKGVPVTPGKEARREGLSMARDGVVTSMIFCPQCRAEIDVRQHSENYRRSCPKCGAVLILATNKNDPSEICVCAKVRIS